MIYPDEKKFLELTARGNLIPVGREVPMGKETPLSAYTKLSGHPGGGSFLLESAETGGRLGRYSFVGARPTAVMEFRNGRVRLTSLAGEVSEKAPARPDPLEEVQAMLAGIRARQQSDHAIRQRASRTPGERGGRLHRRQSDARQ